MVGAIVVTGAGIVAGTGYHERAGGRARRGSSAGRSRRRGARARRCIARWSRAVTGGRTGPCVDLLIDAGVARVVVAMQDPNPVVNGRGIALLRRHGIAVDVGLLSQEAARLNEAFVTWVSEGRPFVTVKVAASLDGRIAARPGERTALTSRTTQEAVHAAAGRGGRHRRGFDDGPGRRPPAHGTDGAAVEAAHPRDLRPAAPHAPGREHARYARCRSGGRGHLPRRGCAVARPDATARRRGSGTGDDAGGSLPARRPGAVGGARRDEPGARRGGGCCTKRRGAPAWSTACRHTWRRSCSAARGSPGWTGARCSAPWMRSDVRAFGPDLRIEGDVHRTH